MWVKLWTQRQTKSHMEEIEKRFKCPYCHQRISMLLDGSIGEPQVYVEDCEVCCQPIQVTFQILNGAIVMFEAVSA